MNIHPLMHRYTSSFEARLKPWPQKLGPRCAFQASELQELLIPNVLSEPAGLTAARSAVDLQARPCNSMLLRSVNRQSLQPVPTPAFKVCWEFSGYHGNYGGFGPCPVSRTSYKRLQDDACNSMSRMPHAQRRETLPVAMTHSAQCSCVCERVQLFLQGMLPNLLVFVWLVCVCSASRAAAIHSVGDETRSKGLRRRSRRWPGHWMTRREHFQLQAPKYLHTWTARHNSAR